MQALFGKLRRTLDWTLVSLVATAMGLLVITVVWQVVTRYGSRLVLWSEERLGTELPLVHGLEPSTWTEETATYLMIWVALLGASVALGRRAHLGIDFFVGQLAPHTRLVTQVVADAVVLVFSVWVLLLGGAQLVADTLELDQRSSSLGLPMGYIYLAVPLAGFFLSIYALEALVEHLVLFRRNNDDIAAAFTVRPETRDTEDAE